MLAAAAEDMDRGGGFGGGDRDRGNFGGYDESDPFTTNLYVGNIHPDVSTCSQVTTHTTATSTGGCLCWYIVAGIVQQATIA